MIFGQSLPVDNPFSGDGPTWTLIGLLLALLWIVVKMLLSEKDKRIEDAKKNQEDLVQPIANIGKTLERIEDKTIVAKREG